MIPIKVTKKEIEKIKKEYFEKHKIIGTDIPVTLTDQTAKIIAESRKIRRRWLTSIDKSHKMSKWHTEIRSPAGTPRFYGVRECKNCGFEQIEHPAGRFMDNELKRKCPGKL
jgi:hypothetical protein